MEEWNFWSDVEANRVDVDWAGEDPPIAVDHLGRSVAYKALRFGFAAGTLTLHPWPTATVTL